MIRVAINGFGRIGRAFFKLAQEYEELSITAINDLGDLENLAYLLKYDSVYGISPLEISSREGILTVNGKESAFISEKDPTKLPWRKYGIDVVVEATGIFESYEKARVHLEAGARRVVLTAPAKDEPPEGLAGATGRMGINDEAIQNAVDGDTATQSRVDSPTKGKDMRGGRPAAHNIVPSTTGAAIAVTKA